MRRRREESELNPECEERQERDSPAAALVPLPDAAAPVPEVMAAPEAEATAEEEATAAVTIAASPLEGEVWVTQLEEAGIE